MTCLGKYFGCSDMDIALVEAEIYGQVVEQSKVMNGVQYIKGKKKMVIIAEAMSSLMFQCFKLEKASFELDQLLDSNEEAIKDITLSLENDDRDVDLLQHTWEHGKILQGDTSGRSFEEWKSLNACNECVQYWSLFLDKIYPILRELIHSLRQGD